MTAAPARRACAPTDDELLTLAGRVGAACRMRGITIATAESCTGGLIASVLTDVEGRSHAFERGYVVYTDDAKAEELAVIMAIPMDLMARGAAPLVWLLDQSSALIFRLLGLNRDQIRYRIEKFKLEKATPR